MTRVLWIALAFVAQSVPWSLLCAAAMSGADSLASRHATEPDAPAAPLPPPLVTADDLWHHPSLWDGDIVPGCPQCDRIAVTQPDYVTRAGDLRRWQALAKKELVCR